MDEELKVFLTKIAEHQDARMDKMDARLGKMEARLDGTDSRLDAMEVRLEAKLEKVETTLLTEFHKWASPVDAKLGTHRSWFTEVDAELQLLKARLAKLEGRQPPH